MSISIKNIIAKSFFYVLGIVILTMGAALFISTDHGADPLTMVMLGMIESFDFINSIAIAGLIFNTIIIAIIFLLDKSSIKMGTILAALFTGKGIDFFLLIFLEPVQSLNIFFNILVMFIGFFLISLGIAVLIIVNIGAAPYDLLGVLISQKTKLQIRWIRLSIDAISVIVGVVLGAKFGIGTILCVMFIGPLLQIILKNLNNIIYKLNGKFS